MTVGTDLGAIADDAKAEDEEEDDAEAEAAAL
jgi:hypothetical protein